MALHFFFLISTSVVKYATENLVPLFKLIPLVPENGAGNLKGKLFFRWPNENTHTDLDP